MWIGAATCWSVSSAIVSCGGRYAEDRPIPASVDASASDGAAAEAPDASGNRCAPEVPFGATVPVPGIEGIGLQPRLSPDELTAYFQRVVKPNDTDMFFATRASRAEPFGQPIALPINTAAMELDPSPADDGHELFFHSNRDGNPDIFRATRFTLADPFTASERVAELSDPVAADVQVSITADRREVYFASLRAGGSSYKIFRATRPSANEPFGTPARVEAIEVADDSLYSPVISADGLVLFFTSRREGGRGAEDIWQASRASRDAPFGDVRNLGTINTVGDDLAGWVSRDGCRLYFSVVELEAGANGVRTNHAYMSERGR